MNRFIKEQWSVFEGTHGMRRQLMDTLTDADLSFNPGGQNMTLGALCREMGDIEHSYIESLKTFKQDWSYRNTEPGIETSVSKLKAWYDAMDADMKATVAAFSDSELDKEIDRGFKLPVGVQLQVYLQALLIFFGKATIFLRTMDKPLPKAFQEWIG